jgi:hypothetical protein
VIWLLSLSVLSGIAFICVLIYERKTRGDNFPWGLEKGEPWEIIDHEGSFYLHDANGRLICKAFSSREGAVEHRDELWQLN